MSKNKKVLETLKLHISKAKGQGHNANVVLPLETALSIQLLLQIQHSALLSADALVETLKANYEQEESLVRIDEDLIRINEILLKSVLK